jgi:hypothetical protein
MKLPTHDKLIEDVRNHKAVLDVNRVNHREFVKDGVRYFVAWSSERDPNYKRDESDWRSPEYQVLGWCTYKSEKVA